LKKKQQVVEICRDQFTLYYTEYAVRSSAHKLCYSSPVTTDLVKFSCVTSF